MTGGVGLATGQRARHLSQSVMEKRLLWLGPENPHFLFKGKYHCTADLLFVLFGFSCFAYAEIATCLFVWSNPKQSNRRPVVQWNLPFQSECSLLGKRAIIFEKGRCLEGSKWRLSTALWHSILKRLNLFLTRAQSNTLCGDGINVFKDRNTEFITCRCAFIYDFYKKYFHVIPSRLINMLKITSSESSYLHLCIIESLPCDNATYKSKM